VKPALKKLAWGAVVPVGLIALWHWASRGSAVVPSLGSVLEILAHPFREPATLESTSLATGAWVSLLRVLCGFGLAVVTAVPVGLIVGRNTTVSDLLSPAISVMMVISPVAWLPVTILVFGLSSPATALYGDASWQYGVLDQLRFAVIAVIWLGASFPIALNSAGGARGVRDAHLEAIRVLGANRWQTLTKVILPGAAPAIMTGLRLGGGIAWRVIIAAEVFPGTRSGLGYMITTAHAQAAYAYAFAAIVVIAAIGLVLDGSLRLAAATVSHWQPRER
jgi:NitT/TauT family transport system permease protein